MTKITNSAPANLGIRNLGSNIGATLSRQLLAALFGTGTAAIIARLLGPSGNGQYAVALLLPTFLSTFLNLGVASANVYFVGRHSVAPWVAARASARIWLTLSVVGLVIGAVLIANYGARLFPGVPAPLLWLSLLVFPVSLLQAYLSSLLQGVQDFRRYNLAILAGPVITFVLVILLMMIGRGSVASVIGATIIAQTINLAMTYFLALPEIREKKEPGVDTAGYSRKAIQYGYKAHLSNILAFFNYKADIFLVNLLMSSAGAGLYVIAVAMSEKLWILSQAVSTVVLPRFAELDTNEDARSLLTPFIARWVLIITAIGAFGLALMFVPITTLLFGNEYLGAGPPLLVLLPGIVVGGGSRILANDIAARGQPEINMYIAAVVIIVNVAGNLLLIPQWGLSGAAAATTIAYSFNFCIRLWVYARISKNPWYTIFVFNDLDKKVVRHGMQLLANTKA